MRSPAKVRVEKHFRHPPERVFDAFVDPVRVGQWLFHTPDGVMQRTDYDPRTGGAFHIVENRADGRVDHRGEFISLDRPNRIVFDFWTDASQDRTRVTVTFTASGDGCDVVLSHGLAPEWKDYAERSVRGWSLILDSLSVVVEGRRT